MATRRWTRIKLVFRFILLLLLLNKFSEHLLSLIRTVVMHWDKWRPYILCIRQPPPSRDVRLSRTSTILPSKNFPEIFRRSRKIGIFRAPFSIGLHVFFISILLISPLFLKIRRSFFSLFLYIIYHEYSIFDSEELEFDVYIDVSTSLSP